jgi:hypothetical protein
MKKQTKKKCLVSEAMEKCQCETCILSETCILNRKFTKIHLRQIVALEAYKIMNEIFKEKIQEVKK